MDLQERGLAAPSLTMLGAFAPDEFVEHLMASTLDVLTEAGQQRPSRVRRP